MVRDKELNFAELHGSLGFQLARASVPAFRIFEHHIGRKLQLRRAEYSALVMLRANTNLTAKDLANALAISPPNMSVLLDRLAERGLLQRVPDQRDRRSQLVELTDSGQSLASEAAAVGMAMEVDMLAALTLSEQRLLFNLLSRVGRFRLRD